MKEKILLLKERLEELNSGKFPYLLVGVSLLVGLIVCYEAYYLIGRANPTISTPRYLIAVREVGVGRTVSPIDFDLILQTDVKNPPAGAISDQYLDKLRGAKIRVPISPREILTWEKVAARNDVAGSIPKGLRAYQLDLVDTVPLMGGDFVDVMAHPKGKRVGSVLLLDKIMVVESTKDHEKQQVLLAIEPADVTVLDKAREMCEIKLVLRNPDDKSKKQNKNRDFLKNKSRIEILSEG